MGGDEERSGVELVRVEVALVGDAERRCGGWKINPVYQLKSHSWSSKCDLNRRDEEKRKRRK